MEELLFTPINWLSVFRSGIGLAFMPHRYGFTLAHSRVGYTFGFRSAMCEICGATPCKPLGGKLAHEPDLTADDWQRVYDFIRYVHLPFVHSIIAEARQRTNETARQRAQAANIATDEEMR